MKGLQMCIHMVLSCYIYAIEKDILYLLLFYYTGSTRIPLKSEAGVRYANTVRNEQKPFRAGWRNDLDHDARMVLAYGERGIPMIKEALRGVKMCFQCGNIWHRDVNAARNVALVFIYERYHSLKRPFPFQRFKSSFYDRKGGKKGKC